MRTLCIAGKNDIAVNVLEHARKNFPDFELLAVLNRNEAYVDSWQRSAGLYCRRNNIRAVRLEDIYGIKELVFLSVEFDRIIVPSRFESRDLYNIHFSLLPKYKGCNTSIIPILHGESESGVTLHRIRRGIDTGEIIAQRRVRILHDDNSLDLYRKLIRAGSSLAIEYIGRLTAHDFTEEPQDCIGSEYFSRNEIDYGNLELDLNKTAWQIHNQIRAFAFRPYQLMTFRDVKLIGSRITGRVSTQRPGTILEETETHFLAATIDYDIYIYKDVLSMMLAAIREHDNERVKALCGFCRIIHDEDENGTSPLELAKRENNSDILEFFAGLTLDEWQVEMLNSANSQQPTANALIYPFIRNIFKSGGLSIVRRRDYVLAQASSF